MVEPRESRHSYRERTREARRSRHRKLHAFVPPRAYRRAQANIAKRGRKGAKARATMARILVKYGVGTR